MSLEEFLKEVLPKKNKLYRFALSYLKNEEEAKDIVQEVMIKVWSKKESISFYRSLEAWCMTMTKNLSLDRMKSKQYQLNSPIDNDQFPQAESSPYRHTEMNDTRARVRLFIDELPPKQKEIMHLRDVEGYSYQEIAEIVEVDINQVKVNLFRARNSVKKKLINIEDYGN